MPSTDIQSIDRLSVLFYCKFTTTFRYKRQNYDIYCIGNMLNYSYNNHGANIKGVVHQ